MIVSQPRLSAEREAGRADNALDPPACEGPRGGSRRREVVGAPHSATAMRDLSTQKKKKGRAERAKENTLGGERDATL